MVGDPLFGTDRVETPEATLLKILDHLDKMNAVDGRIVLSDLYETEYGIYNHISGDPLRPLASVAFHQGEETVQGGQLEEMMRLYLNKGINDMYGLSFIEFMELPHDIIESLVSIGDEHHRKKPPLPELPGL